MTALDIRPSAVRFETVEGSFQDGSRVRVQEEELAHVLPRVPVLPLDGEHDCLVVGVHWHDRNEGIVLLPDEVAATESSKMTSDYDRVAYIDRAIETLQRARAVLMMGQI